MMNVGSREASEGPAKRHDEQEDIIFSTFEDWDVHASREAGREGKREAKKEHRHVSKKNVAVPVSDSQHVKRKDECLTTVSAAKSHRADANRSDVRPKRPSKAVPQDLHANGGHERGAMPSTNSPERPTRLRSSHGKRPSERRITVNTSSEATSQHTGTDVPLKSSLSSRRLSLHGSFHNLGSSTRELAPTRELLPAPRLRRATSDRNLIPSPQNSPQRRSSTEKASPTRRQKIHRLGTTSGHTSTSGLRPTLSKKSLSARSLYKEEVEADRSTVPSRAIEKQMSTEQQRSGGEYERPVLARAVATRAVSRRSSLSVVPSQIHFGAEMSSRSGANNTETTEQRRTKGVDDKTSCSQRRTSKASQSSGSKGCRPMATGGEGSASTSMRSDDRKPSADRPMLRRASSRRLGSSRTEIEFVPTDQPAGSIERHPLPSTASSGGTDARPSKPLPENPASEVLPRVSEARRRLHTAQSSRKLAVPKATVETRNVDLTAPTSVVPAPASDPPKARRRFSTGSSSHQLLQPSLPPPPPDTPFTLGGLRRSRSRGTVPSDGVEGSPTAKHLPSNERTTSPKEKSPGSSSKPPSGGLQLKNSLHQLCASAFGGGGILRHTDLASVASEMTDFRVAKPTVSASTTASMLSPKADRQIQDNKGNEDAAVAEPPSTAAASVAAAAPYCASSIQIDLSNPTNIDFYFFKTAHQSTTGSGLGGAQHQFDDTTTVTTTRSFG